MKKNTLILFSILLFSQAAYTQTNDLRYEILLNKGMLKDSILSGPLSNCLDISPQNFIALSNGSQVYLLGWGGAEPIGKMSKQIISGFAYTSDGLLLTIQNRDLCFINAEGSWETLLQLPSSHMSVSAGKDVIYLYDKEYNPDKYNAYVVAKGGRYKKLFVSPKPVTGICENGDSIYAVIENGIYSLSPLTGKLALRLALDAGMNITSLSVDAYNDIFYFSTQAAIFACRGNSIVKLTTEFPGSIVKYFGNGLLIFNPLSKDILRIVNIESSIEF